MFLGHDMSVSDFDGRTPLHLASAEGHFECVKFLLQSCDVAPEPTDRYHVLIFFVISIFLISMIAFSQMGIYAAL